MTLVLGETVSETFSTGVAGETFTRTASYISGTVSIWNPTFTDLGGGFYRYSYAPLVAGSFEWGGTSSGGTAIDINFDVEATEPVITPSVTGAGTTTRTMLRRRISRILGNLILCTATNNGSTTTFVDTNNLVISDNALVGRQAYFASGANSAIYRTISANSKSATSITFPAVTSTLVGDVVEIHNVRGSGWPIQEIHDELDGVLREASDSLPSYDREDVAALFDQDSPTVAIPTTFRGIYRVDWLDAQGFYHEIPAAGDVGDEGWWVNRNENELIVNGGTFRSYANDYAIRLYGTKVYSALTTDASTTTCNEEWLVNQVCANLCIQGRERMSDGSRDKWALQFQTKADARRDLLVSVPPANFVLV